MAAAPTIFELLIADHRAVAGVFEELQRELDKDAPQAKICLDLFRKIDALLTPHARAEEDLIYPAFSVGAPAQRPVAEGVEEHALVHSLLAQLRPLRTVDQAWRAKAKVLMDMVQHHVREEENEMFAKARKSMHGEELVALAAEFLAGKERIAEKLGLPPPERLDLPAPARSQPAKS